MTELSRAASHLLWFATQGMDIGAVSMMIYGWREREYVLSFLESVTGLRMNHNYIRPGGVAADLHDIGVLSGENPNVHGRLLPRDAIL